MNNNKYYVTEDSAGERLDTFISGKTGLARSQIQKLVRSGLVTVDDSPVKTSYKVKPGDCIEMALPQEPEDKLIPENISLDVIHEDNHIIVINKPAQMVLYPAAGNKKGTLMNALAARCKTLASIGTPLRPGVVHRLDKETSGVIVIAKDDRAYYSLIDQFKDRRIIKTYMALLYGNPRKDQGEITTPIGRSTSDRKKMSTRSRRGKEAVTRFEVIERMKHATLARIHIITGRTHQIRVHFASVGHPVLGDKTYGKKTSLKIDQKLIHIPRQMLHAHYLKLNHPVTGKFMEFEAPMPVDMEEILKELVQK
jgi:23S rRNA pseudouridine1911/1915/1917 synthase